MIVPLILRALVVLFYAEVLVCIATLVVAMNLAAVGVAMKVLDYDGELARAQRSVT
jgi:hypothetical protein